jgi:hypothetical protein
LNLSLAVPARLIKNGMSQPREELDYVRNDYRHFVSFMAFRFGGWADVRRHIARTVARCRCRICYSPSNWTSSGLIGSKCTSLFVNIDLVKMI